MRGIILGLNLISAIDSAAAASGGTPTLFSLSGNCLLLKVRHNFLEITFARATRSAEMKIAALLVL
jgi:hypothetical protein